jgi:hypothetical protein
VGKPDEKRKPGRLRRRQEANIKMDLRQDGVAWTLSIWLGIGSSGGLL